MTALMPTKYERGEGRPVGRFALDQFSDAELEAMSADKLSRLSGSQVGRFAINDRRKRGWNIRDACTTPPHPNRGRVVEGSLSAKARAAGLPYKAVYFRVRVRGWSEEKALSTPLLAPDEAARRAGRASARKRWGKMKQSGEGGTL